MIMEFRFVLFTVMPTLLVTAICSSSYMSQLFVEAAIYGGVSCSPQDGGKTYCCASVIDKNGFSTTTYCTTCDDTNPPSNCTEREKPKVLENPGRDLSNILQGGVSKGVLEPSESNMTFSEKIAPKSGGVFELPEDKDSKTFNEENNTGNE